MKIWKRLFGMALCLCAAACVLCVGVSAAGGHTDHYNCGVANCENTNHGHSEVTTWIEVKQTDVTENNGLTLEAGRSYYLSEDIRVKYAINIKGTVNLCLNGHSITKTAESGTFYGVITVGDNSTFTLCNCKTGGSITHASGVTGRGVRIGTNRSTPRTTFFIMYGGTISGNRTNNQDGAGVLVQGASFQMYGGKISDNHVEAAPSYGGGGVCAYSGGKFIMSGGEISGNTSNDGGGVAVVSASFQMYGGSIINNNATGYGGGVGLWNDSFTLSGGEISGNTATENGGGVYFGGDTFDLSGGVSIAGNKKSGAANNVYLPTGKVIVVTGELTGGNKIGVTTEALTSSSDYVRIATGNKNYAAPDKFQYENDDASICAVSTYTGSTNVNLVACKHNLGADWEADSTGHWHQCSICGGKNDIAAHAYDEAVVAEGYRKSDATCTSPATYFKSCVCGKQGTETFEDGNKNPDNHTGALGAWLSDEDNHWKEYSCCGVKGEKAAHVSDGPATETDDEVCTECGYVIQAALGHTHRWTPVPEIPATCIHTGTAAHYLCRCNQLALEESGNYVYVNSDDTRLIIPIDAGNHVGTQGDWQKDADKHWKEYSCCQAAAAEASHSGGTATCAAQAVCEVCGQSYGGLAEHTWTSATCVTPKTCSACHTTEGIPLGHDLVHHEAQAATCTENGWDVYDTCSRCDYTTYAERTALGHDFTVQKHDDTEHWMKCSRCETVSGQAAHSYDDDSDTTCGVCGYIRTVTPSAPTPSTPSAPSTPTITVPVTGSRDTVQVSASVSNGTAAVKEIKEAELEKIGTDSSVTVDLSDLGQSVTGVKLPTDTLTNVSKSEANGMEIKLPHAQLHLDREALAAVAAQSAGREVQLVVETDRAAKDTMTAVQKQALDGMKNAVVLEAYFVSNGQRISDFNGGEVELSIPYQASGAIRAWYLKEDGTRGPVSVRYDKKNARLTLFHFSHYVIEEMESSMDYAACAKDNTCPLSAYADLVPTAWYHDGVHYCIENGLMQGISTASFLPNGRTTRAQLVTILWRLEGSPAVNDGESFADIKDDAWYARAVRWAADCGVVKGYDNGSFGSDDAVMREQMVTILYRYAQYKGYDVSVGEDTNILRFNDALTVNGYAIPAMQWACGSGLVTGIARESGMFLAPADTTVRVQTATLMMRFQGIFTTVD